MKQVNKIFKDLMKLCENSDAFYYKDVTSSMLTTCRIFGYRFIPAYSEWLKPSAKESRGILFEMNGEVPVKILARPMEKFFNINENEFTLEKNLDFTGVEVFDKADGSLVSIYLDNGSLACKTIKSLFSDQALAANRILHEENTEEQEAFYLTCLNYAEMGYTINCEYVAPDNQVVLYYDKPEIKVLNVRNNTTGVYIDSDELVESFGKCYVAPMDKEYSKEMYNEVDTEGYVLLLKSGQRVKLKTHWYLSLHRLKDSVMNDNRIIDCIIDGSVDDIIPLLNDSPMLKRKIEITTEFINKTLFDYYIQILDYHNNNKHKTRKPFAIGFNLESYLMSPTMKLYEGSYVEDDIIEHLKQHVKKYNTMYSDKLLKSGLLTGLINDGDYGWVDET